METKKRRRPSLLYTEQILTAVANANETRLSVANANETCLSVANANETCLTVANANETSHLNTR